MYTKKGREKKEGGVGNICQPPDISLTINDTLIAMNQKEVGFMWATLYLPTTSTIDLLLLSSHNNTLLLYKHYEIPNIIHTTVLPLRSSQEVEETIYPSLKRVSK